MLPKLPPHYSPLKPSVQQYLELRHPLEEHTVRTPSNPNHSFPIPPNQLPPQMIHSNATPVNPSLPQLPMKSSRPSAPRSENACPAPKIVRSSTSMVGSRSSFSLIPTSSNPSRSRYHRKWRITRNPHDL
jgi:hypothetical protein